MPKRNTTKRKPNIQKKATISNLPIEKSSLHQNRIASSVEKIKTRTSHDLVFIIMELKPRIANRSTQIRELIKKPNKKIVRLGKAKRKLTRLERAKEHLRILTLYMETAKNTLLSRIGKRNFNETMLANGLAEHVIK